MNGYPNVSGVGLASGPVTTVLLGSQLQPSPAVATDVTYTVPDAGAVYEIIALRLRLVTDGNAANRFVSVLVKDAAGNEVYRVGFETAFVASNTYFITLTEAVGSANGGVTNTKAVTIPLPEGPYLPRWTISTSTASVQAGDQYSQVSVWYRALYAGPPPTEP